ncbi:uncharacterized protein LOC124452064 [Xenia sp. Carnegie-2017]|uniref:uncharacterized protein LOC124452064 n=1 Tax=Xenia sp. Carnegie-2017 TaxID=2897299 RepID=UPI001F03E448|nr:uncharacterized protein LOC124452064 [Xenia sp. Carnegie-2017]
METILNSQRLDSDPNSSSAAKEWNHWLQTFNNFIQECGDKAPNKHRTLINYVSHNVYDYIEDCQDFDSSIEALNNLYMKPPNEIFARHLLATRQLYLKTAFDQANALDLAQKNSEAYAPTENSAASISTESGVEDPLPSDNHVSAASKPQRKCYFCGDPIHNRKECPARSFVCNNCGKTGHYAKVCQSQAVKGRN